LIQKAPELGDGLAALFELLDRGDDLVAVEDVEKIVDRPLAVPLARFHVARQDGLCALDRFHHLLLGGHRRTPRNSHAPIQWESQAPVPDPPRNRWKSRVPAISNPWAVIAARNAPRLPRIRRTDAKEQARC